MAAAVHQPLSANSQSFGHYPRYSTAALTMPSDVPVAPLASNHSTSEYPEPPVPDPSLSDLPGSSQTNGQSAKKRRASKGKIPSDLKRSASTPHMRSLAAVEGDSLSPTTDKKRNKLGYHRTSVACGHCRRRKIRCLPAPDDRQGRCSNCIRLKKECNFYPVDQEAQHSQQKTGGSGPKVPSASNPSSPRTVATSSHESAEDFNNYNTQPSNPSNSRFILSSDHEGSTTSSAGSGTVVFQAPSAMPPHMNPYADTVEDHWNPNFYAHPLNSDSRYEQQNPGYWRPQEPESASAYGHDSKQSLGYSQPRMGSVSSLAFTSADESQNWSMPARSMSYGNLEALSQQYSHQPPSHHEFPDRSAVHYAQPQTLDTSGSITSTTVSAPLSAPVMSHGGPGYGYTQSWNHAYRGPAPPGSDPSMQGQMYSQPYFAEPGSLQQIKEEHVAGASPYPGAGSYYQVPDSQILR